MNTCDTCKWWGGEPVQRVFPNKPNRRICSHMKLYSPLPDEIDAADIFRSDDSSIITGPRFGCVHHEPL